MDSRHDRPPLVGSRVRSLIPHVFRAFFFSLCDLLVVVGAIGVIATTLSCESIIKLLGLLLTLRTSVSVAFAFVPPTISQNHVMRQTRSQHGTWV